MTSTPSKLQHRTSTVYDKRVEWCLLKDPSLTREEIKIILQSFSKIDENGDGRISKRELARAYRLAGFNPTRREIDNLLREHDTNEDGYIDFEEYFDGMKSRLFDLDIEKETMKAAFKVFDRDGDGYITIKELERALRRHGNNLTRIEINDIMKAADANNDGRIDYDGNNAMHESSEELEIRRDSTTDCAVGCPLA